MASEPLACPSCARTFDLDARFCPVCKMPLVYAGRAGLEKPVTDQHERLRKIKPQLAEGDLVRVAGARHQAEGEFIQALLLEEGVPSVLKRSLGFDVPDFLAAGPRDVLVPQSGVQTAREVLLESDLAPQEGPAGPTPWKLMAVLVAALALVALVAWLGLMVLA